MLIYNSRVHQRFLRLLSRALWCRLPGPADWTSELDIPLHFLASGLLDDKPHLLVRSQILGFFSTVNLKIIHNNIKVLQTSTSSFLKKIKIANSDIEHAQLSSADGLYFSIPFHHHNTLVNAYPNIKDIRVPNIPFNRYDNSYLRLLHRVLAFARGRTVPFDVWPQPLQTRLSRSDGITRAGMGSGGTGGGWGRRGRFWSRSLRDHQGNHLRCRPRRFIFQHDFFYSLKLKNDTNKVSLFTDSF